MASSSRAPGAFPPPGPTPPATPAAAADAHAAVAAATAARDLAVAASPFRLELEGSLWRAVGVKPGSVLADGLDKLERLLLQQLQRVNVDPASLAAAPEDAQAAVAAIERAGSRSRREKVRAVTWLLGAGAVRLQEGCAVSSKEMHKKVLSPLLGRSLRSNELLADLPGVTSGRLFFIIRWDPDSSSSGSSGSDDGGGSSGGRHTMGSSGDPRRDRVQQAQQPQQPPRVLEAQFNLAMDPAAAAAAAGTPAAGQRKAKQQKRKHSGTAAGSSRDAADDGTPQAKRSKKDKREKKRKKQQQQREEPWQEQPTEPQGAAAAAAAAAGGGGVPEPAGRFVVTLTELLVDCEAVEQLFSRLQPGNTLHLKTQVGQSLLLWGTCLSHACVGGWVDPSCGQLPANAMAGATAHCRTHVLDCTPPLIPPQHLRSTASATFGAGWTSSTGRPPCAHATPPGHSRTAAMAAAAAAAAMAQQARRQVGQMAIALLLLPQLLMEVLLGQTARVLVRQLGADRRVRPLAGRRRAAHRIRFRNAGPAGTAGTGPRSAWSGALR